MAVIRVRKTVEKDGEIVLTDLPLKKGQRVHIVVESEPIEGFCPQGITAQDLLDSGLVGMWADRQDIGDSLHFSRQLREKVERRRTET